MELDMLYDSFHPVKAWCFNIRLCIIICTRLLLASGISEIKYIEDYKNDELVEHFCNQLNVKLIKL